MTLDIGPLGDADAHALALHLAGAALEVAARCVERAGGNPLFLEQLLRAAGEALRDALPGSIQSLVLARLDRLAPADKAALQAASVLGQRVDLAACSALVDAQRAEPLVEAGLLRPDAEAVHFVHALIRDGTYASLLKARRRELHLRAAAWFAGHDLGLRAEHLALAGSPEAAAGEAAVALSHRNAEAMVTESLGLILGWTGDAEAPQVLERAAALSHEAGMKRFELLSRIGLARTRRYAGAGDGALALTRASWRECTEIGAQVFAGPLLLAELACSISDAPEADALLAEAEALLARGAVAHNHFWLHGEMIWLRLRQRRHDDVLRHADALEAFTRDEPVVWATHHADAARAGARGARARRQGAAQRTPALARAGALVRPRAERVDAGAGAAGCAIGGRVAGQTLSGAFRLKRAAAPSVRRERAAAASSCCRARRSPPLRRCAGRSGASESRGRASMTCPIRLSPIVQIVEQCVRLSPVYSCASRD